MLSATNEFCCFTTRYIYPWKKTQNPPKAGWKHNKEAREDGAIRIKELETQSILSQTFATSSKQKPGK